MRPFSYTFGQEKPVEEIAISKFKATCLEVLERVRRTRKPVRVTRYGRPIAEVNPPSTEDGVHRQRLGAMKGTVRIKGDIVSPANDPGDWETLK
jgi:prevent-host-death family protein